MVPDVISFLVSYHVPILVSPVFCPVTSLSELYRIVASEIENQCWCCKWLPAVDKNLSSHHTSDEKACIVVVELNGNLTTVELLFLNVTHVKKINNKLNLMIQTNKQF